MSLSDCKVDENEEEKTELGIWRTNNFALGKAIQILPQCHQCCQNIPMQFCKFATISIFEVVTFDSSGVRLFFQKCLHFSQWKCSCAFQRDFVPVFIISKVFLNLHLHFYSYSFDIKKLYKKHVFHEYTHCFCDHTLQYEFLGCDHLYLNSPPQMFVMRAIEKNVLIRDFFKCLVPSLCK